MSEGLAIRLAMGNALRSRRVAGGLSLATVAERAELSTAHLSDVERGVKEISTDRLARACAALDMPPAELFAQVGADLAAPEGPTGRRPAPRVRLVQSAERLSPAGLRTVAEFSAYLASKEAGGRRRRIGFEF
jgi:transcriptional regulator with XRE-family HTH domain